METRLCILFPCKLNPEFHVTNLSSDRLSPRTLLPHYSEAQYQRKPSFESLSHIKTSSPGNSGFLSKHAPNPRQASQLIVFHHNLPWILPLPCRKNIRQDIPVDAAPHQRAPRWIPTCCRTPILAYLHTSIYSLKGAERRTLHHPGNIIFASHMFPKDKLSTRLQKFPTLSHHTLDISHRTQNLNTQNRVHTPLYNATALEHINIFNPTVQQRVLAL